MPGVIVRTFHLPWHSFRLIFAVGVCIAVDNRSAHLQTVAGQIPIDRGLSSLERAYADHERFPGLPL